MVTDRERIKWLDIAKGITIILVVFGHTMRGGAAQRMVYSFHVAAFFFLSGMLCGVDHVKVRIRKDFVRIMIPYYCFGLISIGIYAVLGKFAGAQFGMEVNTSLWDNLMDLLYGTAKRSSLRFNAPLWFLPCLFVTKLMYYGLGKLVRGRQCLVFPAAVVLAAGGYVYTAFALPKLPFALDIAVKMLPFFSLGRILFCSAYLPRLAGCPRPVQWAAGAVLLAVTFVIGYVSPKVNYSGDTFPNIPAFCVTASLGSAGICFLSMGIGSSKLLEHIGRNTLAILVMHKFPVLFFQTIGPFEKPLEQYDTLQGNLLAGLPVALISVGMCLIAAAVIDRLFPFLFGRGRKAQAGSKVLRSSK